MGLIQTNCSTMLLPNIQCRNWQYFSLWVIQSDLPVSPWQLNIPASSKYRSYLASHCAPMPMRGMWPPRLSVIFLWAITSLDCAGPEERRKKERKKKKRSKGGEFPEVFIDRILEACLDLAGRASDRDTVHCIATRNCIGLQTVQTNACPDSDAPDCLANILGVPTVVRLSLIHI